jgi:hypothetical protein
MKAARITLFLGAALAACAALSLAQTTKTAPGKSKDSPLTGTWQCTAHGGKNGDMAFTLYLTQDGDTVTGSVSSQHGDADLTSATFSKSALEIHIDSDDGNYLLTGKLQDAQLTGDWSQEGGDKGTWEGKKGADAGGK